MKRIRLFKQLAAFLLVCGVLLPVTPARIKARMAMPPAPDYKTMLNVREINKTNGAIGNLVETLSWPLHRRGGVSFVRPFRVSDKNFIFYLRKHSGEAFTHQFGADGQIGATTDFKNLEAGWTSADFIYIGANTYLVLHNSFTGQVRTYQALANGAISATPATELKSANWQDTHLFSPYLHNGQWRIFALDPWTGKAMTSAGDWTKVTENQWTRGWTSLDHLTLGGTAYRLVYKAAGDPLQEGAEQAGRLVIQKLGADGITPENIYDDNVAGGWTSVSFAPSTGEATSPNKILFYRNDTGGYETRVFDPLAGVGQAIASGTTEKHYTDLKAVVVGASTLLTALNEENARPFTAGEAEKMGLAIHNGLKNKAVGYQFLLMQSGKVIYSRAYSLTRLAPAQTPMTTRTRLDLGSIGKMMTTMTTLKLVEQGKVFLYQPVADQIDEVKYPAGTLNQWVEQRNVIDLMKQTTGLKRGSPGCEGDEDTFEVTCQPFFTASPTLECKNGLCERWYNNANFGALRQVIENVSGTTTTAELAQYTHNLWAKQLDLAGSNAMSCSAYPNAYSFQRCAGGEGCVSYNGAWWRQEEVDNPYSTSCGAGGWHASARQMGEFMSAARYAKVLADNVNDLFMSTKHTALVDGAPVAGATALGWEPAWTAESGGEKLLHKDGARIGVAYVTQLPNRMDAVLIVNTKIDNHPKGLLREAYKYAAGIIATPPVYVEVTPDGSATGGEVGEVAINTISNAGAGQHATTTRGIGGALRVTGWEVTADGSINQKDTILDGVASEIAITDGEGFVTAVRNVLGKLRVTAWSTTSGLAASIEREGSATGVEVDQVAATRLAGVGPLDGRVATAVRNGAGNLQLDVWDFHNASDQVINRDAFEAGAISEVAVKTLRSGRSLAQTARLVTAVRNGGGILQVDIWDVDENGQLTRKGKAVAGAVTGVAYKNRIAIGRWAEDDFFTASINGDGKLEVIRWTVSESGLLTKGDQNGTNGEITGIAVAASATVMRVKDDGKFKLINWRIVNNKFVRYGEAGSSDKVLKVAATGAVLSATQLENLTLKLIKWAIVD